MSRIIRLTPQINYSSPQAAGLVAAWPMNDGSGGYARDPVAGYSGTLSGATWDRGIVNNCLRFSGTAGVKVLSLTDTSATKNITLSAWIKPTNNTQSSTILGFARGDAYWKQYGRALIYESGSVYAFGTNNSNRTPYGATLPNYLDWHHVVGVLSAAGALYIDGVLVATGNGDSGWVYNLAIGAALGASTTIYKPFAGYIADARIYSRALNACDIQAMYLRPWELYAPPRGFSNLLAGVSSYTNIWCSGHRAQQLWVGGHRVQQVWYSGVRLM